MSWILASQSPRRRELLGLLGREFTVCVPHTEEIMDPQQPVYAQVAQLSRQKALAVSRTDADTVIAADTVVVCNGKVLGKPKDEAQAFAMLRMLSGSTHQVMTGLSVLKAEQCISCTEVTEVHFRELTDRQILDYIQTGEPMDKAGAYGIQGGAALFVTGISGDYYNVMGLPVCRLGQILEQLEELV